MVRFPPTATKLKKSKNKIMNIIVNIENRRIDNEAGNGIGRIDYAYDGYDYRAEKNKLGIL